MKAKAKAKVLYHEGNASGGPGQVEVCLVLHGNQLGMRFCTLETTVVGHERASRFHYKPEVDSIEAFRVADDQAEAQAVRKAIARYDELSARYAEPEVVEHPNLADTLLEEQA